MRLKIVLIIFTLALQACAEIKYKPAEYPLRAGLIPTLSLTGPVTVSNAQPSTEPTNVSDYRPIISDLKSITEVMVQQTIKELEKNGKKTAAAPAKTIALKVNSLVTSYSYAFYWTSKLQFQATLGNGTVIEMTVPHSSGMAIQDLNGCIAESVMMLLKDERVRAYLAQQ